jgi:hypothetical protein
MDGSGVGVAAPDPGQSVEAATRADCQNRLPDVPQDEVKARVIAARQPKGTSGAEQAPGRHQAAGSHP